MDKVVNLHELQCNSKKRKRKEGEEDVNEALDSGTPLLYIRIDPEMEWICDLEFTQPVSMWLQQLKQAGTLAPPARPPCDRSIGPLALRVHVIGCMS